MTDCLLAVLPLPLGFMLDQLLGDPPHWPHPVRWIGRLITFLELLLRACCPERLGGMVLWVLTVGLVGGVVAGIRLLAEPLWPRLIVETLLIWWGLAARDLARHTQAVVDADAIDDARRRLSQIVGRDTADLSYEAIHRAGIETVAENTSDGVVAPLFYAGLFGPVGMWVYKAINTLDSMVGYRNPRYERFGWASARLDDLANWLPARLSWLLIAAAAWLSTGRIGAAFKIGWRDGRRHPSPNAGWPEAAMAGALGVQLGGPSAYGGVMSEKAWLGDHRIAVTAVQVRQAIHIMLISAWLMILLAVLMRLAVIYLHPPLA